MSTPETAQPTTAPEQVYVRTPEVEIFENDEALWVSADMPGVAPGNVDVSLDDGTLTVDGRVADSPTSEPKTARHFRRRFALRDPSRFDTEHISAVLRHGVLEVRLPKAAQARRRQIPVTVN